MTENRENSAKDGFQLSRRHALMGGMMMIAGGAAFVREPVLQYRPVDPKLFNTWIPDVFRAWENVGAGDIVLPPPDELSKRLYDNLVTRVYRRKDGVETMVLLAYNNRQDGMLQVHRPEVCYPVGGFTLTPTLPTEIAMAGSGVPSSKFTARSPSREEHVLYFTRVGTAFPRTWGEQKLAVMQANLGGAIPDGMMLRVSSLIRDEDTAFEVMNEFCTAFYEAAAPGLQALLARQV